MKTSQMLFLLNLLILPCVITPSAYAETMDGGMFSPYLVGTYDLRNANTLLQVVNPTANALDVYFAFFDDNEKALKCVKEKLSHNDIVEVNVKKVDISPKNGFGVVKIVSLVEQRPFPGIIGFQRHFFSQPPSRLQFGATESNLAAVPASVLDKEFEIIMDACK